MQWMLTYELKIRFFLVWIPYPIICSSGDYIISYLLPNIAPFAFFILFHSQLLKPRSTTMEKNNAAPLWPPLTRGGLSNFQQGCKKSWFGTPNQIKSNISESWNISNQIKSPKQKVVSNQIKSSQSTNSLPIKSNQIMKKKIASNQINSFDLNF